MPTWNPQRITKEIKVQNRLITVNELTVREIKQFWNELINLQTTMNMTLTPEMKKIWSVSIVGLDPDEIDDFTPSMLKTVYEAFREVNAVFFDLIKQFEGENPVLVGLRQAIVMDLVMKITNSTGSTKELSDSSNEDTENVGTTDTVSS